MKLNALAILERLGADQRELLETYVQLLKARAVPLGLIAPSDAGRLWERHVLDSLRGLHCMAGSDRTVVDLGSGAGLPGIPLGIARPGATFTLVEARKRRAGFLEAAVQELGLSNVSVFPGRAEDLQAAADLCLARALGPAVDSWRVAAQAMYGGGRLLYWAGRTWTDGNATELLKDGAKAEICLKPMFQWEGPLVIITRSTTTLEDG